jgi:hypothetical protein
MCSSTLMVEAIMWTLSEAWEGVFAGRFVSEFECPMSKVYR